MLNRRTLLGASIGATTALAVEPDPAADLPDFSNAGYKDGGVPLPDLPVRTAVKPESGDATARIQAAIDRLAALPEDRRGAVLLARGEYEIGGTLRIPASGIVLRGEGDGTVLIATGTKPRSVVEIGGGESAPARSGAAIVDGTVAVGARTFRVASAKPFRAGQLVIVRRSGNAA